MQMERTILVLLTLVNAYYASSSDSTDTTEVTTATLSGSQVMPVGTFVDDLNTDEISGITYNSVDGSYYAIVDNLVPIKGFYEFTFSDSSYQLVSGTEMDPSAEAALEGMDSEGIAFIRNTEDPSNSYFIVAQEGHNYFNTDNNLYLYQTDGTYISTISDQLNPLYDISNTESNKALEALTVDLEQEYIAYTTEKPLLSDTDFCNCVRISVNNFEVDTANNNVEFDELYQLRYDLDTITSSYEDAFIGVSDIAIFQNENGDLTGLVLERAVLAEVVGFQVLSNKIYLVDLTENDNDVSSCDALSDEECAEIDPIDKTLLFDFTGAAENVEFINFEALSILYDGNSVYDENGMVNLVAISDNAGVAPTAFAFLQWDAGIDGSSSDESMLSHGMSAKINNIPVNDGILPSENEINYHMIVNLSECTWAAFGAVILAINGLIFCYCYYQSNDKQ